MRISAFFTPRVGLTVVSSASLAQENIARSALIRWFAAAGVLIRASRIFRTCRAAINATGFAPYSCEISSSARRCQLRVLMSNALKPVLE
jgi:hypothetical protein